MVAAVRCPNAKCRKFMLVEDADQGKVVACLICKQPVKVPLAGGKPAPAPLPAAPLPAAPLPVPFNVEESTAYLSPIFDDDEPQFKME